MRRLNREYGEAVRVILGLTGIMVSQGNPIVMGVSAGIAIEALVESDAKRLIKNAKEPVKRLVRKINNRSNL